MEIDFEKAKIKAKENCEVCNGSGIYVENAGMCGGCEVCGNKEEILKLCECI